jgi:prepilin-type processing-associated H-X9-DG protein
VRPPNAASHPAGANVAIADGSVRFLKNSMSPQSLWTLGSIAQNEVVASDAF